MITTSEIRAIVAEAMLEACRSEQWGRDEQDVESRVFNILERVCESMLKEAERTCRG